MSLSEQNRAQDALRWIYKHGFRHSSECPASVNEAFNQAFANERAARAEGVAALQQAGEPVARGAVFKIAERAIYRTAHDGPEHLCGLIADEVIALFSPQQTALVEEGVEEIIGPHEPAACGASAPSDAPRSDGWQEIESNPPPHNKTVLLGWQDWRDGRWISEVAAYSTGERFDNGYSNLSLHGSATHWMSLPPPPTDGEVK